jgi:hypothetical protein
MAHWANNNFYKPINFQMQQPLSSSFSSSSIKTRVSMVERMLTSMKLRTVCPLTYRATTLRASLIITTPRLLTTTSNLYWARQTKEIARLRCKVWALYRIYKTFLHKMLWKKWINHSCTCIISSSSSNLTWILSHKIKFLISPCITIKTMCLRPKTIWIYTLTSLW